MNHFTHQISTFPDGAKSFVEVPFEVGADIERIEVSYTFPAGGGGSTIDLGLAHDGRVRGWTGAEYAHVFVTEDRATAGYHPGPLEGKWDVVLGIVKLGPDCIVDLDIRLIPRRPVWLAGELHSHTEHSDGGLPVTQAVHRAQTSGCDFLALTDHNATAQNRVQPEDTGLLLIPGMELTTYWGHTNFLGVSDPVDDWRCATISDVPGKMAEAQEKGATIVINHPCSDAGFNRWLPGWDVPFDAMEIWNGHWAKHNVDAVGLWQELLASGRKVACTGGSDFHLKNRRRHGRPANRLLAPTRSRSGILEAVRKGANVVCSAPDETMVSPVSDTPIFGDAAPAGADLAFSVTGLASGDDIRLISDSGVVKRHPADGSSCAISAKMAGRFVRLEVWHGDMPKLFTNPIYAE